MIPEPAELNDSAIRVFNVKPCSQRTTRNQENATLEATLGIEPKNKFSSVQVDGNKNSKCAPNVHRMCTAFKNQRRSEAFFMAFSIVNPNRSEASRSAVGIKCV
jgi:hypothetical protein